ncbi:MAG TPA: C40 family peptidase [Clostridium sp.]|uniref:C40 family peptidase n=1 Tax=Clostridium sp. TaxID=1506 RepID=UPI002F92974A
MKIFKKITSFALALFVAGSLSISNINVQAKSISISGTTLVTYAKQFIGTPYKSGGTTSAGFDCSGFTMYIFNHFNIKLPRIAKDQTSKGTAVSKSNLRTGDLVFFGSPINHVGMYVGDGKLIHSPKPGSAVKIIELKYMPGYNTARRITT